MLNPAQFFLPPSRSGNTHILKKIIVIDQTKLGGETLWNWQP